MSSASSSSQSSYKENKPTVTAKSSPSSGQSMSSRVNSIGAKNLENSNANVLTNANSKLKPPSSVSVFKQPAVPAAATSSVSKIPQMASVDPNKRFVYRNF